MGLLTTAVLDANDGMGMVASKSAMRLSRRRSTELSPRSVTHARYRGDTDFYGDHLKA